MKLKRKVIVWHGDDVYGRKQDWFMGVEWVPGIPRWKRITELYKSREEAEKALQEEDWI